MTDQNETAALVVEHTIRQDQRKQYEKWLSEILKAVSASRGYLGREVFPPTEDGKPYTTVVRFKNQTDVQLWLDSPERRAFIESMKDAFEKGDQTTVKAGLDIWFSPNGEMRKSPAYKQFLLAVAAIYPVTLIIPRLLEPLFAAVPILANPFIGNFFVTLILVGLLNYLIMPFLTKLLKNWLFD